MGLVKNIQSNEWLKIHVQIWEISLHDFNNCHKYLEMNDIYKFGFHLYKELENKYNTRHGGK